MANTGSDVLPTVTVIMPIRNEAGFIRTSLGAVLAQDYPRDKLEVILADGMSTDGTRDIIAAMQAEQSGLRILDNPDGIVPTGLNRCIKQAHGEVVVRVDGHTVVERDYVRQCVMALRRSGADNVGGRMVSVATGRFGRAVAAATSSRFGVGGARFHYSQRDEWVDTVYLGAWRIGVFERIGLFDEEQVRNQDDEFNYRLRADGGRILLSSAIRSRYYNRTSLRQLGRQYWQYGYWKVRVLQKHSRQMQPRHFVPPLFIGLLALSGTLAPFTTTGRWLGGSLLLAYAMANLGASLMLAWKRGWNLLPHLPVAFATLHVAYGAGFLAGLAWFWNRWGRRGSGSRADLDRFAPTLRVPGPPI